MMRKYSAPARKYLAEVRNWLPYSGKMRKIILGEIHSQVAEFLRACPEADYAALVDKFGTPQQISESFVDSMDMPELLRDLRASRKVIKIVSIAVILVFAMWLGTVVMAFASFNRHDVRSIEIIVEEESRWEEKEP